MVFCFVLFYFFSSKHQHRQNGMTIDGWERERESVCACQRKNNRTNWKQFWRIEKHRIRIGLDIKNSFYIVLPLPSLLPPKSNHFFAPVNILGPGYSIVVVVVVVIVNVWLSWWMQNLICELSVCLSVCLSLCLFVCLFANANETLFGYSTPRKKWIGKRAPEIFRWRDWCFSTTFLCFVFKKNKQTHRSVVYLELLFWFALLWFLLVACLISDWFFL